MSKCHSAFALLVSYRQFVSGITYVLTLDGVVIVPASVEEVSISEIVSEIDFVNMQNEIYEVVTEVTKVYRYRIGFEAYFEHVIKISDLEQIVTNLETSWRAALSGGFHAEEKIVKDRSCWCCPIHDIWYLF